MTEEQLGAAIRDLFLAGGEMYGIMSAGDGNLPLDEQIALVATGLQPRRPAAITRPRRDEPNW